MPELSDLIDRLLPVGALILGWLLNEFSSFYGNRQKKKEKLNQVIALLLEVKTAADLLFASRLAYDELAEQIYEAIAEIHPGAPPAMSKKMEYELHRQVVENTYLVPEEVAEKFTEAANILAPIDPFLSLFVHLFSENMSQMLDLGEYEDNVRASIELIGYERLKNVFLEGMRKVLPVIARKHSLRMWLRIKMALADDSKKTTRAIIDATLARLIGATSST